MAASRGSHQVVVPSVLEEMYWSAKELESMADHVLIIVTTMEDGSEGKEFLFPVAA